MLSNEQRMQNQHVLYRQAVEVIKSAILQSQYNAVKSVNANQLGLYFAVGRYISLNTRKGLWGSGAIDRISEQLQKEMPGLRGFSATTLKMMRTFYEEWHKMLNSSDASDELPPVLSNSDMLAVKTSDMSDELTNSLNHINIGITTDDFFSVSFSHHYLILSNVHTPSERLYYLGRAAREHLPFRTLKQLIAQADYKHKGQLPSNFTTTLTNSKQALKAINMFKDSYLLDFINTEELGVRDDEDIDEHVLEQSIVHNIKNFILTFGQDFSFMGNQYRIEAGGKEHFIDLLFYNRELQSLVAVELKAGEFKAAYLGQLHIYLQALDDYVRKPYENPSIGIILCKSADRTYVEYAVRDYDKPMGVATFSTSSDMPDRMRKALPDIEQLRQLM